MPVMQRMIHRSSISDFVLEPGATDPEAPMASATLVGEDGVLRQVRISMRLCMYGSSTQNCLMAYLGPVFACFGRW